MASFVVRALPARAGVLVVRVAGDLDLAATRAVSRVLVEQVPAGVSQILVDLTAATFLDASGIGALLAAHRAAAGRGQALRVSGASGLVRAVLEMTGVDGLLGGKSREEPAG